MKDRKPEIGLIVGMFLLWGLAAYVLLLTGGCISVNLAGGRTIIVTQVMSDRNQVDSGLEAETSLKDSVKDLLRLPDTDITVPDIPEVVPPEIVPPTPLPEPPVPPLPLPEPEPEPNPGPGPADSVMVDGEWIPAPDNPDAKLGVGVPGWVERNQALHKPRSESSGRLVTLLPVKYRPKKAILYAVSPDHSSVQELETSQQISRSGHNGNRSHIRWSSPGERYSRPGHVTHYKVYMEDGTTRWWVCPTPSRKHVMELSRHQDS